jgi:hypothetical protein
MAAEIGAARPTPPVGLVGVGSITHVPKALHSGRPAISASSWASGTSKPPGQTTKNLMVLTVYKWEIKKIKQYLAVLKSWA